MADASCLVHELTVTLDRGQDVRVADRPFGNQIDLAAEHKFQVVLEAEIDIQRILVVCGIELDQEIQVAARFVEIIASRRAKQLEAHHASAPAGRGNFMAMRLDDGMHSQILAGVGGGQAPRPIGGDGGEAHSRQVSHCTQRNPRLFSKGSKSRSLCSNSSPSTMHRVAMTVSIP